MRNYNSQLKSLITGAMIASVGGFIYVTTNGGTAKASLLDADGGALSNPLALTNGSFDFNVADSVGALDLYIQSPTGHFAVVKNVSASGPASIFVDTSQTNTAMVIPFDIADTAAATETSCGFTIIGAVQPNVAVDVKTIDASMTIDVGTDSGDSGDADGFIDGASVATAGYTKASLANGAVTLGADLYVQDSANAGDAASEQNTDKEGKEITYTLSASADTAAGFIILPVQLPVSSL